MAKKYTVEIQADVKGEKETQELANSLEQVSVQSKDASENMENLKTYMDEVSRETENLNDKQEKASKTAGSLFYHFVVGTAQARLIGLALKGLGAAIPFTAAGFAVLTGAIMAFRAAVQSANDYMMANVDAQKEMTRMSAASVAWGNAWHDLSVSIGEFFFEFKKGLKFLKEGTKLWFLLTHGQMDYYYAALATNAAQEDLTWNLEKTNREIKKLQHESKNYLRTVNDTTKSEVQRTQAMENYGETQIKILDLEKKRIQDQIIINKNIKERGPEEENALTRLRIKLDDNTRAREDLALAIVDMDDKIKESRPSFKEHISDLDEARVAAEAYFKVLEDERKWREEVDRKAKEAEKEDFTLEDEEIEDPEFEALMRKVDAQNEYKEFLGENLKELGGMWGNYFTYLKDLYNTDEKFAKLSAEEKVSIIAGTAAASLGIANQLLGSIAAASSDDFETQKKYKVAGATISMFQGIVSAVAGAMTLGPIAGPPVAAALGAMVAGIGLANISKIRSSTPESPSAGGDVGGVNGVSEPSSAPSFSLINPLTNGESQLSQQLGQELEPQKAYVVSGDMSSQQALDRRISNQATI